MSDTFSRELVALLPRLRRFALGLCAEPDAADELVQEACAKALRKQAQWQPGSRLDSWMYKITQNCWYDSLRSSGRKAMGEPVDADFGDGQRWEEGMQAKISLNQTLTALAQMEPAMREVLALVCIEGMSYKQTAEFLDLPQGTVMSRLSRARKQLHHIVGFKEG